jgi:hypothetical protein
MGFCRELYISPSRSTLLSSGSPSRKSVVRRPGGLVLLPPSTFNMSSIEDKMGKTEVSERFYVYDRRVSPLTRFSAINLRYWVVDRSNGLMVDQFVLKKTALEVTRDLNKGE